MEAFGAAASGASFSLPGNLRALSPSRLLFPESPGRGIEDKTDEQDPSAGPVVAWRWMPSSAVPMRTVALSAACRPLGVCVPAIRISPASCGDVRLGVITIDGIANVRHVQLMSQLTPVSAKSDFLPIAMVTLTTIFFHSEFVCMELTATNRHSSYVSSFFCLFLYVYLCCEYLHLYL